MYTLRYTLENKDVAQVKDKLAEMSLAYKSEHVEMNTPLTLSDNELNISGFKAIVDHLENLSKELHQWYYCDC